MDLPHQRWELDRGQQRPSETEFVAVGVNEVEVALSPFGIAGHGSWLVSCCERTTVKCINIGDVEDYAPPPGPAPLGRLGNEVKIAPPTRKLVKDDSSPPCRTSNPSER